MKSLQLFNIFWDVRLYFKKILHVDCSLTAVACTSPVVGDKPFTNKRSDLNLKREDRRVKRKT